MEYITITHHRGRRINLHVAIEILKQTKKCYRMPCEHTLTWKCYRCPLKNKYIWVIDKAWGQDGWIQDLLLIILWLLGEFFLTGHGRQSQGTPNHSAEFGSTCPLAELAIIITWYHTQYQGCSCVHDIHVKTCFLSVWKQVQLVLNQD